MPTSRLTDWKCLLHGLAGLLLASAASDVAAHLELMVEDASIPYSQADGTGYANDVVRAAFAAEGVEVRLNVVPYARCKAAVVAGRIAGCFNMSREAGFQGKLVFADRPLFRVGPRYYRRAGTFPAVTSEQDIPHGARIGIVNGYEYPASTVQLARRGVILDPTRTEAANLRKLMTARLDFAILMVDDLLRDSPLLDAPDVHGVEPAFAAGQFGSYLGFSLRHPRGETARERFNRGYEAIIANGTLRAIRKKWGYPADAPPPAPRS